MKCYTTSVNICVICEWENRLTVLLLIAEFRGQVKSLQGLLRVVKRSWDTFLLTDLLSDKMTLLP